MTPVTSADNGDGSARAGRSSELPVATMGIVNELLDRPGLYIGTDGVVGTALVGAARIVVTALPGGAGVSLDDEILNGLAPGPVLGHVEQHLVRSVPRTNPDGGERTPADDRRRRIRCVTCSGIGYPSA